MTMRNKKIIVPDEMLKAAQIEAQDWLAYDAPQTRKLLEAALRQLSEHPIVPTDEQLADIRSSVRMEIPRDSRGFVDGSKDMLWPWFKSILEEWQRRMFLAPEPEVPEAIKDLMRDYDREGSIGSLIVEAYRRGQRNPK